MSPPPQQGADDYLNVHGHYSHEKHGQRRQERKHNNTREGTVLSSDTHRQLASGSRATDSENSEYESCGNENNGRDADSPSNASSVNVATHSPLQNRLRKPYSAATVDAVPARAWLTAKSSVGTISDRDSPAINALRRLSQPAQADPVLDFQSLRRMSSALKSTWNLVKLTPITYDPHTTDRGVGKTPREASRKTSSERKGLSYRDVNHRCPTFRDSKGLPSVLGTPATITLRKASNVHDTSSGLSSRNALMFNGYANSSELEVPKSELLAFYSTPNKDSSQPKALDTLSQENLKTSANSSIEISVDVDHAHRFTERSRSIAHQYTERSRSIAQLNERSRSVAQLSERSNLKRHSNPAETAITFTDVHLAPGTFAVEPKSSKPSLVHTDIPRRISVIYYKTRNSIHEIIWKEDETTSDCSLATSSRTSATPQQQEKSSGPDTPNPEGEGSPTQRAKTASTGEHSVVDASDGPMQGLQSQQVDLFQWSWDTPQPSTGITPHAIEATNDPLEQSLLTSKSDLGLNNPTNALDPHIPKTKGHSISEIPTVQFFPPLRDRSSTSEWTKAPLVDLNDPIAGRVPEV
ncbi:hypothetical protein MMC28_000585 [Mycoblastus sanguinarius]|nr:hypothetical protein [Mycoblastus sanguinarius]